MEGGGALLAKLTDSRKNRRIRRIMNNTQKFWEKVLVLKIQYWFWSLNTYIWLNTGSFQMLCPGPQDLRVWTPSIPGFMASSLKEESCRIFFILVFAPRWKKWLMPYTTGCDKPKQNYDFEVKTLTCFTNAESECTNPDKYERKKKNTNYFQCIPYISTKLCKYCFNYCKY